MNILCFLACALVSYSVAQSQTIISTETPQQIIHRQLFTDFRLSQEDTEIMAPSGGKKNIGLAVVYSLLLPGMGELYVGRYDAGKYFTIIEGGLWLGLGAVDWYASGLEEDAHRFAAQHAGTTIEGKNDDYFIDIGNFNNVNEYNETQLRSRDIFDLYDPNSSDAWQWDSEANREYYRDRRVHAEEMFNSTRFVVAAIAVNHVISAINAGRLAVRHNKSLAAGLSLDVHAKILSAFGRPNGMALSVSKSF